MHGKIKRALVIGTGMMGPGIALTLARGGLEVKLAARTLASVQRGMDSFRANLKILRDNDLITKSEAAGIEKRVSGTTEIFEVAARADLIAESVLEDVGIKQESFKKLEGVCRPSTLFTTNTLERERHANVRRGDLGYPARAIRTVDFLYIRNLRPDRWPAGDPELYFAVGPFGDCDGSPTKDWILSRRSAAEIVHLFHLAFEKRSAEELYDLKKDPYQMTNVAGQPAYAEPQKRMREQLDRWMKETADPRAIADDDRWDKYHYFGERANPQ